MKICEKCEADSVCQCLPYKKVCKDKKKQLVQGMMRKSGHLVLGNPGERLRTSQKDRNG